MNALISLGLAIAGAKFSSITTEKKENLKVESIKQSNDPVGENIYESKDYDKNKNIIYEKNKRRVTESYKMKDDTENISSNTYDNRYKNTYENRKGGMVPAFYNTTKNNPRGPFVESDFLLKEYAREKMPTNVDDSFLGTELKITNNTSNEKKYYEETKNDTSYIEQFDAQVFDNTGNPVALDGVHNSPDMMKRLNIERKLALEQGWSSFNKDKNMTYNVTPASEFKHNNMTPFFRKGSYGSPEYDEHMAKVNQRKMELFTGSSNQVDYKNKVEVEAMFKPQMGLSNVYGMPTMSGQMKDRYAMALTENRKRQSEIPIEYVRVNKGLNLDYSEHGSDGFHPWFRPLPKTVDELRAGGKGDKVSLGNVVIPGLRGSKRGIQAPINKNRPERFKEQIFGEDILPSYGYLTAQAPRKNFDLKPTLREQQTRAYVGNQYSYDIGQNVPDAMFPKMQISSKQNIGSTGVRNVYNNNGTMRPDTQIGQNERSTTTINEWVGQANPYNFGFVVDPMDVPDPTIKQQTLYDNSKYTEIGGIHMTNMQTPPSDTPNTTLKELGLYQYAGILGNEYKAGMVYNPYDVPKTTIIEQTIDTDRAGHIIGNIVGTIHPTDAPAPTIKEQTINNTNIGHIAPYNNFYAHNPNDVQPVTMKQQTINNKHVLNVNKESQTGYLTNPQEAKTTGRQLIENNKHVLNVNKESQTGYLTNPQEAKTTGRQLIENNKHIINVNKESQTGYLTNPQEARTTGRELIENNKHVFNVNRESQTGYLSNPQEARTTGRQLIENNRHVINVNKESQTGYLTNPQEARTTGRQLIENNRHIINVNRESQTGYLTNPQEAKTTGRQLIENNKHVFNVNRESQTGYLTNPQEAKTTLRQLTEQNKHIIGVNRESQTGYITNPQEAKTTLRQLTEDTKHITGVNRESQTGYMTNIKNAPVTLKQLIEQNKYAPTIDGVATQTGYTTNNYTAKPTTKQTTLFEYVGQTDGRQTGTGYSTGNFTAKTTARQGTLYAYLGNAESQVAKNPVYKQYYETPIDDKKEIAMSTGRMPTLRNYNMVPDGHLTEYRVKNDCDDMRINRREPMPTDATYNQYTQKPPSVHVHQFLPQYDMRQDSAILTQLNMNPFAIEINPICVNNISQPVNNVLVDISSQAIPQYYPSMPQQSSFGTNTSTSYGDMNYEKNQ